MLESCDEPDQVKSWDEIFINVSNMIEKLESDGQMPAVKIKTDFKI